LQLLAEFSQADDMVNLQAAIYTRMRATKDHGVSLRSKRRWQNVISGLR
jgi:hypothetical protein